MGVVWHRHLIATFTLFFVDKIIFSEHIMLYNIQKLPSVTREAKLDSHVHNGFLLYI